MAHNISFSYWTSPITPKNPESDALLTILPISGLGMVADSSQLGILYFWAKTHGRKHDNTTTRCRKHDNTTTRGQKYERTNPKIRVLLSCLLPRVNARTVVFSIVQITGQKIESCNSTCEHLQPPACMFQFFTQEGACAIVHDME